MISLAETPLTGEPYAGDPHVRFGGRGEVQTLFPTSIQRCMAKDHATLFTRAGWFISSQFRSGGLWLLVDRTQVLLRSQFRKCAEKAS